MTIMKSSYEPTSATACHAATAAPVKPLALVGYARQVSHADGSIWRSDVSRWVEQESLR